MAMTLVSTVTVGSGGAASIEFTGIAGTGKDLLVLYSLRVSSSGSSSSDQLLLNGSSANFTNRSLYGTGSATGSGSASDSFVLDTNGSTSTASTFGNGLLYIANYASSANKSFSIDSVTENNATAAIQSIYAGQWANSAAITSLTLSRPSGTWVQHSTASLYIIS
jgi:hypothetical protein